MKGPIALAGLVGLHGTAGAAEISATTDAEAVELYRQALEGTERLERLITEIRRLAFESASERLDDDERQYLQDRYLGLAFESDWIVRRMRFDGQALAEEASTISGGGLTVELPDLRGTAIGIDTGSIDLSTATGATSALSVLDDALDEVDTVGDEVREALIDLAGEDFHFVADRRNEDTDLAEAVLERATEATWEVEEAVERLHALAVRGASEHASDGWRATHAELHGAIVGQIERTVELTRYNGLALVDGTCTQFDVRYTRLDLQLGDLTPEVLEVDEASLDLSTAGGSTDALSVLDNAKNQLRHYLTDYGTMQARIDLGWGPIVLSADEPGRP